MRSYFIWHSVCSGITQSPKSCAIPQMAPFVPVLDADLGIIPANGKSPIKQDSENKELLWKNSPIRNGMSRVRILEKR